MERSGSELDLPGFRFYPTEEELLDFYLRRAAGGRKLSVGIIGSLNLYLYDPWDLPVSALAKIGEREWYFFVPRDRRPASGGRPNRTTERGFWKATGSDRPIRSAADPRRLIGLKKILVYYRGRGPRGRKTDWVMNEYRLPDVHNELSAAPPLPPMEDVVLCKVYRKATSMRELEQRAAMEQDDGASAMAETASPSDQGNFSESFFALDDVIAEIKEERVDVAAPESTAPDILPEELPETPATRQLPSLPAIQVPSHGNFEWIHDAFVTQLRSPWLDQWSPLYAQLLNF